MGINTSITLVAFSLFLIILTTYILKKGEITIKYALLWYCIAIVALFPVIFPSAFEWVGHKIGVETISNLIIAIILGLIILMMMVLTIICSRHKKRASLLVQELAIVKKQVDELLKKENS